MAIHRGSGRRHRLSVWSAALLAALGAAMAAGPAQADHDGPLAGQWHLDVANAGTPQTTPDSSGHGLTASASAITVEASGRFGAYLSASNSALLSAGPSVTLAPERVTLVAWVKHYGAPPTLRYIAARGGDGPPQGCQGSSYALYTGAGSPGLYFYIRPEAGGVLLSPASTTLWDANWHMVAGVFDGSSVQLYVDGAAAGAATPAPAGTAIDYTLSDNSFTIDGYAEPTCGNANFPGGIDEVRVYDRALSAAEIGRLAASSTNPVLVADDFSAPETTITGGPAEGATLAGEKAVFEFTSSEPGSSFQCRVWNPDTQVPPAFAACASPFTAPDPTSSDLAELKMFEVRASDSVGNVDPTSAVRTYSTDNKPVKGAPEKLKCEEVDIVSGTGYLVHNGCRIAPVEKGKVRCVHALKLKVKDCRFMPRSGSFVVDENGKSWALVGQPISKRGNRGGKYLVASPIEDKNRIPCGDVPKSVLRAVHGTDTVHGRDTAGKFSGVNLGGGCVTEKYLVAGNRGGPLQNVANAPVCTSTYPHPDSTPSFTVTETVVPGMPAGIHCYIGKGAGLNDPIGRERDSNDYYLAGGASCHQVIVGSGPYATGVIVGKRPATTAGSKPQVILNSPLVWRPYSSATIANVPYY